MTQIYPNKILFTGAGFSMDFGGFSAQQMGEEVFNHIDNKDSIKLRNVLLKGVNGYETVASEILNNPTKYSHGDTEKFYDSIRNAYMVLNESIKAKLKANLEDEVIKRRDNKSYKSLNRKLISFVELFDAVFTLNQDTLLELLSIANSKNFKIHGPQTDHGDTQKSYFEPDSEIKTLSVDTTFNVNTFKTRSYYKLHGSSEWNENGKPTPLIIGTQKLELIDRMPLFKSMLNIFEQVMKQDNTRVVVVGYGGHDKHINKIIKTCKNIQLISPNAHSHSLVKKSWFSNNDNIYGLYSKTLKEILENEAEIRRIHMKIG